MPGSPSSSPAALSQIGPTSVGPLSAKHAPSRLLPSGSRLVISTAPVAAGCVSVAAAVAVSVGASVAVSVASTVAVSVGAVVADSVGAAVGVSVTTGTITIAVFVGGTSVAV